MPRRPTPSPLQRMRLSVEQLRSLDRDISAEIVAAVLANEPAEARRFAGNLKIVRRRLDRTDDD